MNLQRQLIDAIFGGDRDAVEHALAAGAVVDHNADDGIENEVGDALFQAVLQHDAELVALLLEHGAYPNGLSRAVKRSMTSPNSTAAMTSST